MKLLISNALFYIPEAAEVGMVADHVWTYDTPAPMLT
jgi:hypothetical protein